MVKKKTSTLIRYMALILVLTMVIPIFASAATAETVQPRGSYYLSTYGAYVYLPGNGEVQVYFDVTGTGVMDELGALSIEIHESTDGINWDWVETFNHDTTPGMLSYNDDFHTGHVTYDGTVGCFYKAYVCIWGGENGDGDARWFWTSAKR